MCGRYALYENMELLRTLFDLAGGEPELEARYNIAPTQAAWVVREQKEVRTIEPLKWGLVPAEGTSTQAKPSGRPAGWINARSETVESLASFRDAFRARRCIVPASGFYEWAVRSGGKDPYFFHRADGGALAFAGIWEPGVEHSPGTFAILTTAANGFMRPYHDRMPVILEKENFGVWLSPSAKTDSMRPLLHPSADDVLVTHRVSRSVNKTANEGPACIQPEAEEGDLFGG